jgi:hypothetical protein
MLNGSCPLESVSISEQMQCILNKKAPSKAEDASASLHRQSQNLTPVGSMKRLAQERKALPAAVSHTHTQPRGVQEACCKEVLMSIGVFKVPIITQFTTD